MPGLAATLDYLARFNRLAAGLESASLDGASTHPGLTETHQFGANPGALRMLAHAPATLPDGAPLMVVLHGCSQSAAGYDHGAAWSELAGRHGFAVLLPEQSRANNSNLCFNWFHPADTARGGGEALSIREIVDCMIAKHRIDPARVFITGLSAGGAMAAAMLAAYPEVFAGGAVIAGLPVGAASSVHGAVEAMFQGRTHSPEDWGDRVRSASSHHGPWPRVQIWQGDADSTVAPSNAAELTKQWADVQGVVGAASIDVVDGVSHCAWRGADGRVTLETFVVRGLAHGVPLDTGSADRDHALGAAGPYMLEAGISSTWHIAHAFGLLDRAATPV